MAEFFSGQTQSCFKHPGILVTISRKPLYWVLTTPLNAPRAGCSWVRDCSVLTGVNWGDPDKKIGQDWRLRGFERQGTRKTKSLLPPDHKSGVSWEDTIRGSPDWRNGPPHCTICFVLHLTALCAVIKYIGMYWIELHSIVLKWKVVHSIGWTPIEYYIESSV